MQSSSSSACVVEFLAGDRDVAATVMAGLVPEPPLSTSVYSESRGHLAAWANPVEHRLSARRPLGPVLLYARQERAPADCLEVRAQEESERDENPSSGAGFDWTGS